MADALKTDQGTAAVANNLVIGVFEDVLAFVAAPVSAVGQPCCPQ
jgi:hypothetical protein